MLLCIVEAFKQNILIDCSLLNNLYKQINKLSLDDINAFKYSFTLYLPEHIQNILPKILAENNLSLIEGEERKTITIEYTINPDTQDIISRKIYKSVINIKRRYDYIEFNKEY